MKKFMELKLYMKKGLFLLVALTLSATASYSASAFYDTGAYVVPVTYANQVVDTKLVADLKQKVDANTDDQSLYFQLADLYLTSNSKTLGSLVYYKYIYNFSDDKMAMDKLSKLVGRKLTANPNDDVYNLVQGRIFVSQGNYDAAVTSYRKVLDYEPSNEYAKLFLAREMQRKGQVNEAIQVYNTVFAQKPNVFYVQSYTAQAYLDLGQVDKANELFKQAQKYDPKDSLAYAGVYTILKDKLGPVEMVETLYPGYKDLTIGAKAFCELGDDLYKAGLKDEAAKYYRQAIVTDKSCAEAYESLVKTYVSLGDEKSARSTIDIAKHVFANDPAIRATMIKLLLTFVSNPADEAQKMFDAQEYSDVVTLVNAYVPRTVNDYNILIKSLIETKDYSAAVDQSKVALLQYPKDSNLYYLLAVAQKQSGDLNAAKTSVLKSISFSKNNDEAKKLQKELYAQEDENSLDSAFSALIAKDYKKADKCIDAVFKHTCNNPKAYYCRSIVKNETGTTDKGLADLLKAYELDRTDYSICLSLAKYYDHVKENALALQYYKECLKLAKGDSVSEDDFVQKRIAELSPVKVQEAKN